MKKFLLLVAFLPSLVAAQCNPPPQPPAPISVDAGPVPTVVVPPPPDPIPTVAVDAGPPPVPTTTAEKICASLAADNCAEGKAANCAATIQHAIDARLVVVPAACLIAAHSKPAVHACGKFVACP